MNDCEVCDGEGTVGRSVDGECWYEACPACTKIAPVRSAVAAYGWMTVEEAMTTLGKSREDIFALIVVDEMASKSVSFPADGGKCRLAVFVPRTVPEVFKVER